MTDDPRQPWFPIRTKRLLLREARLSDYDDIHAYAVDADVVRYMDWGPNTPEVTAQALGGWVAMSAQWPRDEVNLVVELSETGRAVDPEQGRPHGGLWLHSEQGLLAAGPRDRGG